MSYEYNTSVLNIQAVAENKMNTRRGGLKFYTVEITDFDNETEFFEVEARSVPKTEHVHPVEAAQSTRFRE